MLRLAAQKSEGEAQALARRIKSENPEVAQASHRVEEVVFGGMGTFYRANVGPVADIANARRLCAAIRAKGIDCEAVQR